MRSGTQHRVQPIASPSWAPATVGSLVAYLCGRLPGAEVTLVDINPARAELARVLGVGFAKPETAKGDCDLVVHASGNAAGLGTALALAGEEATVLELSWYGDAVIAAPLGGAFHSRRLRLISSQVGRIAPSHRPRWTHGRRLAAALALLADPEARRSAGRPRWRSTICRGGCPIFLTPAMAYSASPSSIPEEVPCSLLKFATIS